MAKGRSRTMKDITHPDVQEAFNEEMSIRFKLCKIVSRFSLKFQEVFDKYLKEFSAVAASFKKKSEALMQALDSEGIERFTLLKVWLLLLEQFETDIQSQSDLASKMGATIYGQLEELTVCKKEHVKLLFKHCGTMKSAAGKNESAMLQAQKRYHDQIMEHGREKSECGAENDRYRCQRVVLHNEYVLQLASATGALRHYRERTLPALTEELKDLHLDVGYTLNNIIQKFATQAIAKAKRSSSRYESVVAACNQIDLQSEISSFFKTHGIACSTSFPDTRQYVFQFPEGSSCCEEAFRSGCLIRDKSCGETELELKKQSLEKEASLVSDKMAVIKETIQTLIKQCQRQHAERLYAELSETRLSLAKRRHDLQFVDFQLQIIRAQNNTLLGQSGQSPAAADRRELNGGGGRSNGPVKEVWQKLYTAVRRLNSSKRHQETTNEGWASVSNSAQETNDSKDGVSSNQDPVYRLLRCASTMRSIAEGEASSSECFRSCSVDSRHPSTATLPVVFTATSLTSEDGKDIKNSAETVEGATSLRSIRVLSRSESVRSAVSRHGACQTDCPCSDQQFLSRYTVREVFGQKRRKKLHRQMTESV